jgi:hypothetical protein
MEFKQYPKSQQMYENACKYFAKTGMCLMKQNFVNSLGLLFSVERLSLRCFLRFIFCKHFGNLFVVFFCQFGMYGQVECSTSK